MTFLSSRMTTWLERVHLTRWGVLRAHAKLYEQLHARIASDIRDRISGISSRDRRTLVIGALVVAASLVVFRGIPAWYVWTMSTVSEAQRSLQDLSVTKGQIEENRILTERSDSIVRAYSELNSTLLHGDTPPQAVAVLASHVSEIAMNAGVRLGTVQLLTDSVRTNQEVYRVRVRVDGTGDIRGITTLFSLLESMGTPLLAIRTVSISQSDVMAPPERAETLRVAFVVEGIARREVEP